MPALLITADNCRATSGIRSCQALNRLLAEAGFDRWIEARCEPFYEQVEASGQRSIPTGADFRMVLDDLEAIESQRPIVSRCADSLSLWLFLKRTLEGNNRDHSTLSLSRRRLPHEVSDEVPQFVLKVCHQSQERQA